MTASTSSSPRYPGSPEPRHRASGGRGYGRETETSGPIPVARRESGRHRAPDAPPSSGFTIVPGPRETGPRSGEESTGRSDVPGGGFRPLPPSGPTTPSGPATPRPSTPPASGLSSIGVPLGAVPTQRATAVPRRRRAEPDAAPDDAAISRRRAARPVTGTALDDEAVTVPIRREALDRAAARGPVDEASDPPLRPLAVQRPTPTPPRPTPRPRIRDDAALRPPASRPAASRPPASRPVASRPAASDPAASGSARPAGPPRGVAPWATPPVDGASTRLGLVAVAIGLLGGLVALAPWSGLLPRVLPVSSLGITPVFNLVGALLGVVALGLGAVAMFRAVAASRGLLAGVVGACAGAAAIVVGLVV
jgi:hypothetical protein